MRKFAKVCLSVKTVNCEIKDITVHVGHGITVKRKGQNFTENNKIFKTKILMTSPEGNSSEHTIDELQTRCLE